MSPSYKAAFGSFLKQEDLQGKAVQVAIESVDFEMLKDGDKDEKKLIMRFVGKDKGLVLNRTNCEAMEHICGTDDYGAWVGWVVVLFTDPSVKFGGKTVGGLRIRATGRKPAPVPVVEEAMDDEA